MSVLAQKYELPANGAELESSSAIAAALATIGIGGGRQITEHRKRGSQDYKFFSFHLQPHGNEFPDFKTADIVGKLRNREIPREGPWDEPTKLFMAAWIALENRRAILDAEHKGGAESLQFRKIGMGLCQLEQPVPGNVHDLRGLPLPADEPLVKVKGKVLSRALMTVGFIPVRFLEDGVLMTGQSITFPGLTFAMCLEAQGAIAAYNAAVESAVSRGALVMPDPPRADLPGGGPHGHPFENALQAGLNMAQILQWVLPRAGTTYAFQSAHHATRSAIIDASAAPKDIDEALRFATKR